MLKASLKGKKKKARGAIVKQEEIEAEIVAEVEATAHQLENMMV